MNREPEPAIECYFSMYIFAPNGLRGIEPPLAQSDLPLEPWRSSFNGKVVLRGRTRELVDWNMDPSNDKELFASGSIYADSARATRFLQSLSEVLIAAGFPHSIFLDDADGELHTTIEHRWPVAESETRSCAFSCIRRLFGF